MISEELLKNMSELELSNKDFATLDGLTPRAIQLYRREDRYIPRHVEQTIKRLRWNSSTGLENPFGV